MPITRHSLNSSSLLSIVIQGWWWQIRQTDPVHCLPIISRNHFDRIPRAAIEKCSIRAFADALLTTNAEIRIDFDAAERRVIRIRHPEHASFDRAVFDTSGRTGAASTAVSRDCQNA